MQIRKKLLLVNDSSDFVGVIVLQDQNRSKFHI